MKRILALLLLIALPVWATVSISEEPDDDNITKITYTWISNASGIATGITSNSYTGVILRVVFNPDDSSVPTAAYDVTVTDNNSADILDGLGADLSATATTQKLTAFSSVLNSKLRINVSNAGASAAGQVIIYFGDGQAYSFADSSVTGAKLTTAAWSEIKSIASDSARAAASDSARLDDVSLADVQSATTSDFHNIGGTDDDIPDADEVVEAAIAGNAVTWAKIDTGATGFVDVRKFGAVDDSTVSSQFALENSLNVSEIVQFPSGWYRLESTIHLNSKGYHIKGMGKNKTFLYFPYADTLFQLGTTDTSPANYYVGTGGLRLEDLTIVGKQGKTIGNKEGVAITDWGCGDLILQNVYVKDFNKGIFAAYGSDFSRFNDCSFNSCDTSVYLGPASQQYDMQNCTFYYGETALILEGAKQGQIDNCHFLYQDSIAILFRGETTSLSGVTLGDNTQMMSQVDILDCWFESGDPGWGDRLADMIVVSGAHTWNGIKIIRPFLVSGGTFDSDKAFLKLYNASRDILLDGPKIYGSSHGYLAWNTTVGNAPALMIINPKWWNAGAGSMQTWYNRNVSMNLINYDSNGIEVDGKSGGHIDLSSGTTYKSRIRNGGGDIVQLQKYSDGSWTTEFQWNFYENSFILDGAWKVKHNASNHDLEFYYGAILKAAIDTTGAYTDKF